MFVGDERESCVRRLMEDWGAVSSGSGPRMVALSAPMGWGKTRTIQEFYERLAAGEGQGYWPERIVSADVLNEVSALTVERKRLQPGPFEVRGRPPYVWLSVHADASEYARPEEAYRALAEQLLPHLHPILRTKRLTRAAAKSFWGALTAFIPIPVGLENYLDAAGALSDFAEEWRSGTDKTRVVGVPATEEQAANLWRLLTSVWGKDGDGGPPFVLAIEDAQFISPASVDLVRAFLSSKLPCLIVAAGWPVDGDEQARVQPYRELLASALPNLRVETLDRLDVAEVRRLVRSWHPGTVEETVDLVAARTGGNPYALRLALIRLDATRGQPIEADRDRIRRMPFDIHAQFEKLLWAMPEPARLALAATALLGYRVPVSMASTGSEVAGADVAAALVTDWLREDEVSAALLAFLEPLRHEVALRYGSQHFSDRERQQILAAGIEVLRRMMRDGLADPDRGLLCDLHLAMAEVGAETNADLVLGSAAELLRILRSRQARSTIRHVLQRCDDLGVTQEASPEARAEYLVERARSRRYASHRSDPATLPALSEAEAAVSRLGGARPDLTATVLVERARIHRDSDTPGQFDLARAREAMDQALAVIGVTEVPELVRHNVLACEYGVVSVEGDRSRASELALAEAARTRTKDGKESLESLEALGDAAWYAVRAGDEQRAVDLSRIRVAKLTDFWASDTHPRVASAKKDLAVRLVRMGSPILVREAVGLIEPAYRILEAAFGIEDNYSLNALSARAYASLRLGFIEWSAGEGAAAAQLFSAGRRDADAVLAIRRRRFPKASHLVSQERVSLASALSGETAGLAELHRFLDHRTKERGQSAGHAEVRWLCADIMRAMLVLGVNDAAAFGTEHGVDVLPELA